MNADFELNDKKYWDLRFNENWNESDGPGQTIFFAELLMREMPRWLFADIQNRNLSICDWGCAEGDAVAYMGQFFNSGTVEGVDFSEVAIAKAQKKYVGYKFSVEDWTDQMPNTSGRADVIVSSNTLEHFSDPIPLLKGAISAAAKHYIVLLIPYAEDRARMEKEHFFRFTSSNIPLFWSDWYCLHFKIIDTENIENTRWRGQQALVVYGRLPFPKENSFSLQLDTLAADAGLLRQECATLSGELENAHLEASLAMQKLETQMLHDKILQKQNESLTRVLESIKKESESTKVEFESTKVEFESTKVELESTKVELESTKVELESTRNVLMEEIVSFKKDINLVENQLIQKETEISILKYAREELNHLKSLRSYRYVSSLKRVLLKLGYCKYKYISRIKNVSIASKVVSADNKAAQKVQDSAALDHLISFHKPSQAGRIFDSISSLRIASILDTFTHACFAPESQLVSFRPDNWRDILSAGGLDLLLVESAWHGNDGAWQYRVGTYSAAPGRELYDMISWCRKEGLPTVFWNKEDPPHFAQFIEAAKEFDYVFTTDENCIPRYREMCGHDRVFALPFAAQPLIHNPVQQMQRKHDVCFAGTYYANRFDERREEMEMLLDAASSYDFEIFDRMHGYAGAGSENYRFPKEFQKFIRGRLEYEDMVKAYRQYKVFLNVNSVANSKTMFSRRVFELLACGTPVVSTQSKGIHHFFGDLVPLVKNEVEAKEALHRLINDAEHWSRTSARGIRLVMEQHTYAKRLGAICDVLGLTARARRGPPVIAVITGQGNADRLAELLASQTLPLDVVFVLTDASNGARLTKSLRDRNIRSESLRPAVLMQKLQQDAYGQAIVLFFSACDYYGPNYARDAVASLAYARVKYSGMSVHFSWDGSNGLVCGKGEMAEHSIGQSVLAATLAARANGVTIELIQQVSGGGMIKPAQPCYARARYEYVQCQSSRDLPAQIVGEVIIE